MHGAMESRGKPCEIATITGHAQSLAEALDQSNASRFVRDMAGPFPAGCGGLAKVVNQHGIANRQGIAGFSAIVERLRYMHAGVELGVILDGLRDAEKRIDLGKQLRERAAGAQGRQEARWLRLH